MTCETLRDGQACCKNAAGVLLLTLVEKLKSVLAPRMNAYAESAGMTSPLSLAASKEAVAQNSLGQQILTIINERLPIGGIQLRPSAAVLAYDVLWRSDRRSALWSRRLRRVFCRAPKGKSDQFFDPAQMEAAQQRLTEGDILTALDNHQFAIWLQPQVEMRSGNVIAPKPCYT
ncbi:hypothetical protein KCP74_06900 [Salmonella enterica subsp. enterica]|nr:hypothetical protein KCP74_06900 [Salmonella enterica subsp. enterica]